MSVKFDIQERLRFLEGEVNRLNKVNESLMNRVERSTDAAGSSYSLFESNLLLQNKVKEHTAKLVQINQDLQCEITERKRTEEKLKLYHRIFMASADAISIVDTQGIIVEINPAKESLIGYSKDEIVGLSVAKGMEPSDMERIGRSLTEDLYFRGEIQYHKKNGEEVVTDLAIFPIYHDDGELLNYIGIERDITQNKKDQEVLTTRLRYEIGLAGCSQALLEEGESENVIPRALKHLLGGTNVSSVYVFENSEKPDGSLCLSHRYEVRKNLDDAIISAPEFQNVSYELYFGKEFKSIEENKSFGGSVQHLPQTMRDILGNQNVLSVLILPVWVNKKWYGFIGFDDVSQERQWSEEEIRLLRTAAEMIGGYFERMQAIKALRASEERFRMLVENSNNVIYSLDPEGLINYLSPKFLEYSGHSIQTFLGRHFSTIILKEDVAVFNDWLSRGVNSGSDKHQGYQARFRDKDGQLHWIVSNASVIRDDSGKVKEIIGVAHDITELNQIMDDLKKANQELRETQTHLIQSEKMASLGMLVAGIAHEINTPIGSVCSMHDTLVRAYGKIRKTLEGDCDKSVPNCEKIQPFFHMIDDANKVIRDGIQRVITIVRRLRAFARLDEAELKRADIHEGLEDTLTLIHHEIKHNIKVNRNYGDIPAIPCYLGRLNQVFVNLLINAKQAIKNKGEITISTFKRDKKVHIEFRDSGTGIPKESIAKIFDPGFTTKGVGVGTGLGLSICYQIIQDHHGEITVKSTVGEGTTFSVILPTNLDEILGVS